MALMEPPDNMHFTTELEELFISEMNSNYHSKLETILQIKSNPPNTNWNAIVSTIA